MNRRWAVPRRLRRPCQGNTRSIEQGRFPRSPRCLAATNRNREQAGQGKPHQPKRDGPRQNKLKNFRSPCHETCPTITLNRYPRLGHHRATRPTTATPPCVGPDRGRPALCTLRQPPTSCWRAPSLRFTVCPLWIRGPIALAGRAEEEIVGSPVTVHQGPGAVRRRSARPAGAPGPGCARRSTGRPQP